MRKEFTGFVTKYALSTGVYSTLVNGDGEWVQESRNRYWSSLKIGRDVFLTEEEALNDAEQRRQKKYASLQRQIDKLKKIQFSVKQL